MKETVMREDVLLGAARRIYHVEVGPTESFATAITKVRKHLKITPDNLMQVTITLTKDANPKQK
jgi:hypothetical protein